MAKASGSGAALDATISLDGPPQELDPRAQADANIASLKAKVARQKEHLAGATTKEKKERQREHLAGAEKALAQAIAARKGIG